MPIFLSFLWDHVIGSLKHSTDAATLKIHQRSFSPLDQTRSGGLWAVETRAA